MMPAVSGQVDPARSRRREETMHAEITNRYDEIAALCQRYGVQRLDLFGSAARGTDFDPGTSDVDFLVEFEQPPLPGIARRFLGSRPTWPSPRAQGESGPDRGNP